MMSKEHMKLYNKAKNLLMAKYPDEFTKIYQGLCQEQGLKNNKPTRKAKEAA